jgi:hypothetical protein
MVNEFGSGRTFPCPEGNPDECYLYSGARIYFSPLFQDNFAKIGFGKNKLIFR